VTQMLDQEGSESEMFAIRATFVNGVPSIIETSLEVKDVERGTPVGSYSCILTPSPFFKAFNFRKDLLIPIQ
jgi:hypothetical protein